MRSASSTTRASRQTWNAVHGCEMPKRDQVPDGQVGSAVEGDERVLVVELRHREARLGDPDDALRATHLDDDRQLLVDGEIASAGATDRETRLGRREHRRPDLDGGLEAAAPRARRASPNGEPRS